MDCFNILISTTPEQHDKVKSGHLTYFALSSVSPFRLFLDTYFHGTAPTLH